MTEINANYDEPWKEAIGDYFDRFLDFFFPEVYNLIDWLRELHKKDDPIAMGIEGKFQRTIF